MKTILITGAASGIGLATARRRSGHMQVVIADRNYEAAALAADEIKNKGGQAFPIAVDVAIASSVARFCASKAVGTASVSSVISLP